MKRLLMILGLVMVMSGISIAQKIQKKGNGEVRELKECVTKYCSVTIDAAMLSYSMTVNIEGSTDIWMFYDEGTGKPIKMKSGVDLLNFMYRNGWIFKDTITEEAKSGQYYQYVFEKKE